MAIEVQRSSDHRRSPILLLTGLLASAGAPAQEVIAPLEISLSSPGARSLGFGGAFVALADDATAAYANPAGLVQLLRPEVSIELRHWRHSTPFTKSGRVENLPSGFGIDTTVGVRSGSSEYDTTAVSFMSVTYPRGDWSVALFRHQYADLGFASETQGLFGGGTSCCQTRLYDQRATSDLNIVGYGLAAAHRINDRLDIGLGATYYDASHVATATAFRFDDDSVESIFAPNSYLTSRVDRSQVNAVQDTDWALTAGFLWRPSGHWSVGGVYRQGLEVDLSAEETVGEALAADLGVPPGTLLFRATGIPVRLPDAYGLGMAYQGLDGRLTLSFQWERVEYSDIPDSLDLDDQVRDDTDELHFGVEYVFIGSTPVVAVRLGAWREPAHQMRAVSDDPFLRALLPRGRDQVHYAAGLGVAMRRFQVDLAVDFADRLDTVSLSMIYNF